MSRWRIMQLAVHALSSVPFSVFKDSTPARPQTGAHFHPTGWDIFYFLVWLSHHCVCLLSDNTVLGIFFHFSVFDLCELWNCFLTKMFFSLTEGGRSKRRNGDGELHVFTIPQLYFLYFVTFLQNHKIMLPSQQQMALVSVFPILLFPIIIMAVGKSSRKSNKATWHR